ncbi:MULTISPECIES: hypothetical protein [Actinomycetes]|uniref:hypothetical protein n=1 Tax=Actinomycetes TaxID=1760 RepID=UPI0004C1A9E0|nr:MULTISPECIES: hypothetical protein [Actinomycetes]
MTTIVFVHGTGVRGTGYSRVLESFQKNISVRAANVEVVPCEWGRHLGTSFAFGGASIPGRDDHRLAQRRVDTEPDADTAARFAVLTAYPLHDLQFLALLTMNRTGSPLMPPGVPAFPEEITAKLLALPGTGTLVRELNDRVLLPHFMVALTQIRDAPAAQEAIQHATESEDKARVATALAEGIIAATLRQAGRAEGIGVPLHGDSFAHLAGLIEDRLGYAQLGAGDRIAELATQVVIRAGSWAFDRWRQPISDGAQPMLGDVVWYLTRGAQLRSVIGRIAAQVDDDVILVGHSLGGIACLDLMLMTSIPSVRTLVTVGSQGPLLYELDSLPGLQVGAEIPTTLPRWVNYYDRRDALSYLAANVFSGRAEDVQLDNGRHMPDSHSAYFDNQAFYDSLWDVIAPTSAGR